MPAMNGTGPQGYGPMTGRGMGRCSGVVRFGGPGYGLGSARGFGRGAGYGPGRGRGPGFGMGRGLGWFAAGYQGVDEQAAGDTIRSALETRIQALRAELAHAEDLLKTSNNEPDSPEGSSK